MMKKLILTILLSILISTPLFALADVCGVVSTRTMFLKNNEYRLMLLDLGKTKSTLTLAPGRHKLSAKVIYMPSDMSSDQNTIKIVENVRTITPIHFDIVVKANTVHQIVARSKAKYNTSGAPSFRVVVKKSVDKQCGVGKAKVASANNVNAGDSDSVPENLQYRLDLVLKDLKNHLLSKGVTNQTVKIVREERIIDRLGIVTDIKSGSISGIKVLAITPLSIAAKAGLLPKDVILQVNGSSSLPSSDNHEKDTLSLTKFKNKLANLARNEDLYIEVLRDKKKVQLISSYEELSIPSYMLNIQMK